MRKFLLIVASFVLFSSCMLHTSDSEYVELAREYLTEAFGGSYSYVVLRKDRRSDEAYVAMKASNLGGKEVIVKVKIHDRTLFSYSSSYSSNYLSVKFAEEEALYYEDFFKKNFSDCKIKINNSIRFIDYPSQVLVEDEETGKWIEAKRTVSFGNYLDIVNQYTFFNSFQIFVTDKQTNEYINSQDRLKATLNELEKEGIHLDGYFYIVDEIPEDKNFSTSDLNCSFKARLNAYNVDVSGYYYDFKKE